MKRKPGYLLQRIADTDYLLPYGQMIADHRRGISLNSTGVYVWELLENEMTREALQEKYLKHFLDVPEQKDMLIEDLNRFINMLIGYRMIEDDALPRAHCDEPCTCLRIGGLVLKLHGPQALTEANGLRDFCTDTTEGADMEISLIPGTSGLPANGTALIENPGLTVREKDGEIVLRFPNFEQIIEVRLSKTGTDAFFYYKPPITEALKTQFFHALRHVFLYLAAMHGIYAIHSASILYGGKAWLFSAPAGTGKTTHANLWKKLYEAPVFNGDLNLLAFDGNCPVVHGIPWCGTSGVFHKDTVPLGGIIFLKQAPTDSIAELTPDKKALYTMQRFVSPMWTANQLKSSALFAEALSRNLPICRLYCTKEDAAAELIKGWVDTHG